MRRAALRIGLVLAASVLALAAAEGALWILGLPAPPLKRPRYVDQTGKRIVPTRDQALFARESQNYFIRYELRPGTTAYIVYDRPRMPWFDDQGRVEMRINWYGLRDVAFAAKPPPATTRILCLGDSFTFGHGVPPEDSYPKQLERVLRARRPDRAVEVLNAGFAAGKDLPNHVAWHLTRGHALEPHLVLLTVCLNDVGSVPMDIRQDVRVRFPGQSWSRVARMLSEALVTLRIPAVSDPDDAFARHYPRKDASYWKKSILVAKEACAKLDEKLLVVIYPMLSGLEDRYPWTRFHTLITGYCREHGVACVDLLPAFRGRQSRDLWAHVTDQHPNPQGHAIAAEALADALEKRGWLER